MQYRITTSRRSHSFHKFYLLVTAALLTAFTLTACEPSAIVETNEQHEMDMHVVAPNTGADNRSVVNRQLAAARAGTAAFHDVEAALDAGFLPDEHCVAVPGVGGMGHHYLNPGNISNDPDLDPATPQILLYEPQKNGRLRLVGVEYVVPYDVVPDYDPAPRLFEQDFQHGPSHLESWTLHVWIWKNNPSGMFAEFNPRVSC